MEASTKSYIKIFIAAIFWGTIGLFAKKLGAHGMSPALIAFYRMLVGFVILFVFFAFKDPKVLRLEKSAILPIALIGIISQGMFNIAYMTSINEVGAFTASVLLYFSPVIMFLLGIIFYKEAYDTKKIISVLLCFAGCFLGVTGGDLSILQGNFLGIVTGLLAALGYSLMPALSKTVIKKYNPFTIIVYSFLFGMIFLIPFANPISSTLALADKSILKWVPLFGLMVGVIPYGLYIPSLGNVQVSKLGVIASIELVVSIGIAVFFLGEVMTFGKLIGVVIVLFSILLMNLDLKKNIVLVLLLVALPFLGWYENNHLDTSVMALSFENLPPGFDGYKIMQLSDLHNKTFGENQKQLIAKVAEEKPDIILITGDIVDSRRPGKEAALDLVAETVKIAPVYYITGNHEAARGDFMILEKEFEELGAIVINDNYMTLERGGDQIYILGMHDMGIYGRRHFGEKLREMAEETSDKFQLLLSHRPEIMWFYVENEIDLVYSGHAHGGQIRLPFIGGLVAPGQGIIPDYTQGSYQEGNTLMVVSRGLGNSLFPLRIANNPEIVVTNLFKK